VLWWNGTNAWPEPLDPVEVTDLVSEGQATVTLEANGAYRLALPIYASGQVILVATATLAPLGRAETDRRRERRRLEKWAQSVCERLRNSDYILQRSHRGEAERDSGKVAWEALLQLDQLLRHLRVHKNTAANQQRVLQAAFGLLRVDSLIWVPCDAVGAVLIQGETCLAPADCRQLALRVARHPNFRVPGPLICNELPGESWDQCFPRIANALVFAVGAPSPVGWVLALNKHGSAGGPRPPFRPSDAALLTPFVALLDLQARTAERHQDLKELLVGLTRSLTAALDAKDSYTCGHSERVARIAVELGRSLGMDDEEIGNIYLAGLLHDIGKIGIRDAVLSKPEALTDEEYAHIKEHVTIGHAILADLKQIGDLLPGVLHHHEHFDGGGYPHGLSGEAIPLLARILAVADAYDAMTTNRAYRQHLPNYRVEEILIEGAGKQWDRRVVEAFLRCRHAVHAIRRRGVGESLRDALDGALRANDLSSAFPAWTPRA
jgi:hypothetical protein